MTTQEKSFEHRREWVRERVKELCGIFALDVCAYAVMSNHVHLVVRTRPEMVSGWSDEEVARRWLRLCPGRKDPLAVAGAEDLRLEVLLKDVEKLKVCRERLGNLSWFMRGLSEVIARRANEEDRVQGSLLGGALQVPALGGCGSGGGVHGVCGLKPGAGGLGGDARGKRILRGGGPSAGASGERRSWRRGRRLAGMNRRRRKRKSACWKKRVGKWSVRVGFRRWMRRRVGCWG